MSLILDTNVLSELRKKRPHARVTAWFKREPLEACYVSVVTLGEIEQGIAQTNDSIQARVLRRWLEGVLLPAFRDHILPLGESEMRLWGRLRGEGFRIGRPVAVTDALLAATAIRHDYTLATRNVTDFEGLGVRLFNPWEV